MDALAARDILREAWGDVRSFVPLSDAAADGIVLTGPRMVGVPTDPPARTGALWTRLKGAWR